MSAKTKANPNLGTYKAFFSGFNPPPGNQEAIGCLMVEVETPNKREETAILKKDLHTEEEVETHLKEILDAWFDRRHSKVELKELIEKGVFIVVEHTAQEKTFGLNFHIYSKTPAGLKI